MNNSGKYVSEECSAVGNSRCVRNIAQWHDTEITDSLQMCIFNACAVYYDAKLHEISHVLEPLCGGNGKGCILNLSNATAPNEKFTFSTHCDYY